ncbi:MAG: MBL fold metallo-hydrolase [Nitrospiraceae bacterium]
MKGTSRNTRAALQLLLLALLALPVAAQESEGLVGPEGFIPPPLHPAGAQLETKQLAPGVYALLSDKPPVDNSGFVVGERGVLVIDAHINGAMARQIQAAVRRVTNKPILYLVNTNFHGDHTFGNYAFPAETRIVAHRETAERMRDFEHEKKLLLGTVNNDLSVFADVRLRLPDVVFDDYLRLDLGGRAVELYHFGPGNTPGDTVVYVPEAQVAWTGNLVIGNGSIPFLIEGGAGRYLQTISRFAGTLEVDTIIPGHAAPATAAMFDRYLNYLSWLLRSVRGAVQAGQSLEETLAVTPLDERFLLPEPFRSQLGPFFTGVHRWNVQATYRELNGR